MINLLLGGPGGGKSYEAVAYHILPALQRGRKVITNLPLNLENIEAVEPGSSSLVEIREKTIAQRPEKIESHYVTVTGVFQRAGPPAFSERAFANPEDFESTWRGVDGVGPLYVVDECHFVMPRGGTLRAVEEWFSMHRHYNCDVLLITQSSGKISAAIKDLVQVCYKVRKATALGRSTGYIRKVLDGVNGGEVSTTQRTYQSQYFKLYRSHTQGLALAEKDADDVAPLTVKFRRISWAFYAVTAVACIWAFWPATPKPKQVRNAWADKAIKQGYEHDAAIKAGLPVPLVTLDNQPLPVTALPPVTPVSIPATSVPVEAVATADPEPFKGQTVHLSGWMRMGGRIVHTFVIGGSGQRLFELQERDVIAAGYKFKPLGECSGVLSYGDKKRSVICDAPTVASGRNSAPLVMALNQNGEKVTSRD